MPARTVFLSYTSELAGERPEGASFVAAAINAIVATGCACRAMRDFPSSEERPADLCRGELADSDIYLGLIGFRHGSPERQDPLRSFVEMEYEEARGAKQLLLFLRDEVDAPDDFARQQPAQAAFRARLTDADAHTVQTFRTPEDLKYLIALSIPRLIGGFGAPGSGRRPTLEQPVVKLRLERARTLVGRDEQLAALDAIPLTGDRPTRVLISGPPGAGKTELAIQFARRLIRQERVALAWLARASATGAPHEKAQGDALLMADLRDLVIKLGEADTRFDQSDMARQAVGLLESAEYPWILVIDGQGDPLELAPWLPETGQGLVIVTSRLRDRGDLIDTGIDVGILDRLAAVDLGGVPDLVGNR